MMLSGIGLKATLQQGGIDIILENAEVGNNFNEHMVLPINWRLKDPSEGYTLESSNTLFQEPQFASGVPITYTTNAPVPEMGLRAAIAADEGAVNEDHFLLKYEFSLIETATIYTEVPPL